MLGFAKWLFLSFTVTLVALQSTGQSEEQYIKQHADDRQGKNLLDWIGFGTGPDTDPYLAKANADCLNGDLAECFKSRALSSLDDFFDKPVYQLTENAKILRMPETQLRQLSRENYEYSESPRADEPEWDQLVKFVLRKVEKFVKSAALEITVNNEVTENGRYSPRFVDEIADEIDLIEDKKDTLFKRKQLKKLFIPLLIILKLFKIKLLLFLPLILGLASFKKLLGFFAIVIPGLIGLYKFCKPDLHSNYGSNYYNTPHYSPAGIAYQPHFKEHSIYQNEYPDESYHGGNLRFREDAHNLAYSAYSPYRNNNAKSISAEPETSSRKSILPDS